MTLPERVRRTPLQRASPDASYQHPPCLSASPVDWRVRAPSADGAAACAQQSCSARSVAWPWQHYTPRCEYSHEWKHSQPDPLPTHRLHETSSREMVRVSARTIAGSDFPARRALATRAADSLRRRRALGAAVAPDARCRLDDFEHGVVGHRICGPAGGEHLSYGSALPGRRGQSPGRAGVGRSASHSVSNRRLPIS